MMMKNSNLPRLMLFASLTVVFLAPQPAHAYIDPGIGSLVFQSVIAGMVAVLGAWTAFKLKLKDFFQRFQKSDKKPNSDDRT
jgi:hypothetical protein